MRAAGALVGHVQLGDIQPLPARHRPRRLGRRCSARSTRSASTAIWRWSAGSAATRSKRSPRALRCCVRCSIGPVDDDGSPGGAARRTARRDHRGAQDSVRRRGHVCQRAAADRCAGRRGGAGPGVTGWPLATGRGLGRARRARRRSLGTPRSRNATTVSWSTPELCGSRSAALAGRVRFVTDWGVEVAADAGDGAVSWGDGRVRIRKRRHPDERHAGFGERAALDQTAGTKTFWNVNAKQYGPATDGMYCSVPVFLAHRPDVAYGFFLNALGWSQIRCEPGSGTWVAEVAGRELDYVVAHGGSPAEVLVPGLPSCWAGRRCRRAGRWATTKAGWSYMNTRTRCARWGGRVSHAATSRWTRSTSTSTIWTDIANSRGTATRFPDPRGLVADLDRGGIAVRADRRSRDQDQPQVPGVRRRKSSGTMFLRQADGEQRVMCGRATRCSPTSPTRGTGMVRRAAQGANRRWHRRHLERHERADGLRQAGRQRARASGDPRTRTTRRRARPARRDGHADLHNLYGIQMAQASNLGHVRSHVPSAPPFVAHPLWLRRDAAVWGVVDRRQHGVVGPPSRWRSRC